MKNSYDYVVLGGGVSGLGFPKRMSENGKSVLVLEKENQVGGLSRSLEHKGFYLDFCAHRFHTNNTALLEEIKRLPGLTMHQHIKKSRIYMFGKWLKYPFEIQQLLRAMPFTMALRCGFSFIFNEVKRRFISPKQLQSYKDWFVHLYGPQLYKVMCYPYTSKIWHHDPSQISADWANQRFQGENLKKLMVRILKKILTLNFSSYNLRDDSLAPDGGPFWYPEKGIQELCDSLAVASQQMGADIKTNVTVTKIDTSAREVTVSHEGKNHTISYHGLVSTIPLHTMYTLQERKEDNVEQALSELRYMDIIFVYLFLDTPNISNDHWLYFPDQNILFNRAVEFSNWSPSMCPEGKTSICFDITCFEGDAIWTMDDAQLISRTIHDAESTGYIQKKDVYDSYVYRVKYAYPFYDLNYTKKLHTIVNHLQQDNTYLLGRTGIFKYNNSDNSIEMGFALAEKIIAEGDDASLQSYQFKSAVSY